MKTAFIVAALGLTVGALIFALQRKLIYFPDPSAPTLPDADRERGFEDVQIRTADGLPLRAWHRPPAPGHPTVLIFHGNAGHRGDRLDLIRYLADLGLGVLALDYRGYGGS